MCAIRPILSGYAGIEMATRLVLQLPTADLRRARIVAATDDPQAVCAFARRMVELAEEAVDGAPDAFMRELAYLEKEQLQARLQYALRLDGEGLDHE